MSDGDETRFEVVLLGVPVALWAEASAHLDALRREFALMLATDPTGTSVPHRLHQLMAELSERFAGFGEPQRAQLERASAEGQGSVDLRYTVSVSVADAAARLLELLDDADEFCRSGDALLTLAAPHRVQALRRWFLTEFIRQSGGEAPTPWHGIGEELPAESDDGLPVVTTVRRQPGDDSGTAVLSLHGDVDLVTAGEVRQALADLRDEGITDVVIDASDVTFLDSVGISVLLSAAKRLAEEGGRLEVRSPSPAASDTLRITGLDDILNIA